MTLMEGSTLASSSIAMIAVVNEASEPPYSAGISIPINYLSTHILQGCCTPCSKSPLISVGSIASASSFYEHRLQ